MSFDRSLLTLLFAIWAGLAQAFGLQAERVIPGIWALVGEIGPRTAGNHLLNNTLGFIETGQGVILVGSGASPAGAALIEQTVARVTDQPIRWVLNIGAQDHHWLGNSYFAARHIPIIALAHTVVAQKQHVDDHLQRAGSIDPEEANTIQPVYADRILKGDVADLKLGGVHVQLRWPGSGHFPGDAIAWLPEKRVLFTGDFVFLDRILGIHSFTRVAEWQQALHNINALQPALVVPGHGHPAPWSKVKKETGEYLDFLVNGVKQALEDWKDLGETTDELGEAPQFQYLKFYDGWHRRNINRTYLQMESTQ